MNMQDYTTPFAINGDRDEFSIDTDPSGNVSLERGWTEPYQLRPEEGGKFIPRRIFNQMMNLVSTDTVTWKTQTFPNWIADKGDGTPYAYPKNAIVEYTNGNVYVSKVANNTTVPTNTTNWLLYNPANGYVELTGDQTIAGVKTFSSSPIVPTPTTGTQAVNKDYADLKVALASFVGTNQSLASSGYQKLPGGLIIQWGIGFSDVSSGVGVIQTFPITFPNAVFSCVIQYVDKVTPSTKALINIYSLITSAVLYNLSESGSRGIYFIALGY